MGTFEDVDDAWLIALTRRRRAETAARRASRKLEPGNGLVLMGGRLRKVRNREQMALWREEQWEAGNRTCLYCSIELLPHGFAPTAATVDHRHPLIPGENDEPWNYAMACRDCNSRKGRMTEAQFWAFLAGALAGQVGVRYPRRPWTAPHDSHASEASPKGGDACA